MNPTFLTGNQNKIREARKILGIDIKHHNLDLDELQELDPFLISDHKVKQGWEAIQEPLFVMDQSIYIDCLNGFPGPLIKWFWEQVTLEKICEIAQFYNNPKIYTETLVTLYDGKAVQHFTGRIDGTIPPTPRGDKGWGWDPIFIPEGQTLTYSEIEPEEVLGMRSHKIALEKLRDYLHSATIN